MSTPPSSPLSPDSPSTSPLPTPHEPSTRLVHLVKSEDWDAVKGGTEYRPPSLAEEGFVHLSRLDQIVGPANRFYRGQSDRLLLVLDADRLDAEVVYEDLYGHGEEFPHLYGPLNLGAVVAVVPYPCGADGAFGPPPVDL